MDKFKIEKPWGPPKLRKLFQSVADAINARTPKKGFGTDATDVGDGISISLATQPKKKDETGTGKTSAGGGAGGTASNIYGSLNGQPAVFHLSQTADPELVT